MTLDIQFKIKSDPNIQRFLRENSLWYKELNRDPSSFKELVSTMKDKYELKPSDRINKLLNNIGMMQSFLDAFK